MVLVAHGVYKFSAIRSVSNGKMYKWLGEAELVIEFLKPIRNRLLRV